MFNFYSCVSTENETRFSTDYLTAEDKRSVTAIMTELNKAVQSCDSQRIMRLARNLINTENRNRKIERHETIINGIIELLTAEMNIGDYISRLEVAETLKKYRPEWCEKDRYGKLCIPLGAVACAFNRLIDTGNYELVHSYNRKYFKRIK